MRFLVSAFFFSLVLTLLLVRFQKFHSQFSHDHHNGPQKFHATATPRIGGLGIYISFLLSGIIALYFDGSDKGLLALKLCGCALPTFIIGLAEDVTKKIGVKTRLLVTTISSGLSIYLLNTLITQIQVPGIDSLLSIPTVSIAFTLIAITGLANAYNIIDGFNGLASMIGMISLLAIGYVAFKTNDPVLTSISLMIIGSIAGFFIWNYPRGLIFLGDGGAYLIGFLIASLSIALVVRNPLVSPWFALLVNAYPIFETLFTIWRRKVHQGKNPGLPDGAHFHSLIYRRIIRWASIHQKENTSTYLRNARTSPYLWFLSTLAVGPAIIFYQSSWILQCFALLFCISYLWAYRKIVQFKTQDVFHLMK